MIARLKYYAAVIGTALIAVLAALLRIQSLKNQRDKLRRERDTLDARVHINKVEKQLQRKKKERLSLERETIEREVSKEGEDFRGLDNLSKPNDF